MLYAEMSAGFSRCKNYRYTLARRFEGKPSDGRRVLFVMLNPSTADHTKDDPTVRRCAGFALDWGYAGYFVANIFALRSTDPAALYSHPDPVGRRNDQAICQLAEQSHQVICAWGNHGQLNGRGREVARMLLKAGHDIHCLRCNATSGEPAHPLYLPASCRPVRLRV